MAYGHWTKTHNRAPHAARPGSRAKERESHWPMRGGGDYDTPIGFEVTIAGHNHVNTSPEARARKVFPWQPE
jgi:hypothetical protein